MLRERIKFTGVKTNIAKEVAVILYKNDLRSWVESYNESREQSDMRQLSLQKEYDHGKYIRRDPP